MARLRPRLRPNPQFYGLPVLASRAVSHEKPCARAHESHVDNDSREVGSTLCTWCGVWSVLVAGQCGFT